MLQLCFLLLYRTSYTYIPDSTSTPIHTQKAQALAQDRFPENFAIPPPKSPDVLRRSHKLSEFITYSSEYYRHHRKPSQAFQSLYWRSARNKIYVMWYRPPQQTPTAWSSHLKRSAMQRERKRAGCAARQLGWQGGSMVCSVASTGTLSGHWSVVRARPIKRGDYRRPTQLAKAKAVSESKRRRGPDLKREVSTVKRRAAYFYIG